jgi:mRNA interferase MazF
LHIPLDERTSTTGVILCEHIKSLDLNSRTYKEVEILPKDILDKVIDVVYSEIEQIE